MSQGLAVVGERKEVSVTHDMLADDNSVKGISLGERGRKWIGVKVWTGWIFEKT